MKTIQTPDQLRENVAMLKRMMGEKTVIHLIPEQGMTQVQLGQCQHNASAFDNYLRAKHSTPEGADYSIQNLKTAYVFLRDNGLLQFEVAPKINKTQTLTDNYGRPVRNLMQERKDAAQRAAEESQQSRRDLEKEHKDAMQRVAVNQKIEMLREEINSFRGKCHADTYKGREEMQKVLDGLINGRRHLYDAEMAGDAIIAISKKYWKD